MDAIEILIEVLLGSVEDTQPFLFGRFPIRWHWVYNPSLAGSAAHRGSCNRNRGAAVVDCTRACCSAPCCARSAGPCGRRHSTGICRLCAGSVLEYAVLEELYVTGLQLDADSSAVGFGFSALPSISTSANSFVAAPSTSASPTSFVAVPMHFDAVCSLATHLQGRQRTTWSLERLLRTTGENLFI
jgi:hypothetical protein